MPPILSDTEIIEIRRQVSETETPCKELVALRTRAELFGYIINVARQRGWDEVEVVDTLIRVATPHREVIREAETLLRALGYTKVCDHLRQIARYREPRAPRRRMK